MTVGPAFILAFAAAALATLAWWIGNKLTLPGWVNMFLFGLFLALVIVAGPLIKLP